MQDWADFDLLRKGPIEVIVLEVVNLVRTVDKWCQTDRVTSGHKSTRSCSKAMISWIIFVLLTERAFNAFMYFIERHLVQSYGEKGYLLYFKRFTDDIIGNWNGNLESLKCSLSEYDNLENGINITHVISFDRLSYLDTWISISKESPHRVEFSTYQKSLNKYLYIPFESFDPNSNKKAFIKGELIR